MNQKLKVIPIFLLIGFIIVIFTLTGIRLRKYYKMNINGVVSSFYTAEKGDPVVFINEQEFPLGMFAQELSQFIEIGDSIVKESNSFCSSLYKKNNNKKYSIFKTSCPKFSNH
ncbi:MAG: hypothetical protein R6W78_19160 [Bacteroidales bacterium]